MMYLCFIKYLDDEEEKETDKVLVLDHYSRAKQR